MSTKVSFSDWSVANKGETFDCRTVKTKSFNQYGVWFVLVLWRIRMAAGSKPVSEGKESSCNASRWILSIGQGWTIRLVVGEASNVVAGEISRSVIAKLPMSLNCTSLLAGIVGIGTKGWIITLSW